MKTVFTLLMTAVVLLAAGTAVFYFYGYKDSFWIQGSAYLPVVFGWLSLLFLAVLLHPLKAKAEQPGSHAWQQVKYAVYFVVYPVLLVGLVGLFAGLEMAKDKRVDAILSNPSSRHTNAIVTEREERRWRTSHHTYAIVTYNTPAGYITQAIKDDDGIYQAGQRIPIVYSPDYPDMFWVKTPSAGEYHYPQMILNLYTNISKENTVISFLKTHQTKRVYVSLAMITNGNLTSNQYIRIEGNHQPGDDTKRGKYQQQYA